MFVVLDGNGVPRGVPVDLAENLARSVGAGVEFVVAANSGELTQGLAGGMVDAALMPIDAVRQGLVDFGPVYVNAENTYLVADVSGIRSLAEIDRPQVRVIGISGTTTIRAAAASLRHTGVIAVPTIAWALEMIETGAADAFALTRDTLLTLASRVPGTRILEESFRQLEMAIAVPKGRPRALTCVTAWMHEAKASGVVRRAFDAAGLRDVSVAP